MPSAFLATEKGFRRIMGYQDLCMLEALLKGKETVCHINPNDTMQTYNPVEEYFADIEVIEKIGTKQGWSCPAPAEAFSQGYPQEVEALYRTAAYGDELQSDSRLAANAVSTMYSAYLSAEKAGAEVVVKAS